jgi:hypothetical protein
MAKGQLFQYAVLWHPNKKQDEEEGLKTKVVVDVTTVLCNDQKEATMRAAMSIPAEYREQLDQVELFVRPF